MSNDKPSSESAAALSEEDARRIVEWVDRNYQRNNVWEFAYKAAEYEHRYMATKQAELVEENERLKSQLKDYCNDCQHPTVNERQAAELSKLRQENEAKRSDLTDKLEEAVHHMDNGHTAQATTLIYEVIGELEPKGE